MDDQTRKAAEDIALIKQVIERTSGSLVSFSRVFALWGILICGFLLFGVSNDITCLRNILYPLPYYPIIIDTLLLSGILLMYIKVSKDKTAFGFSKQLMTIWVCILSFPRVSDLLLHLINYFMNTWQAEYYYIGRPWMSLLYAFGFFCIYIFTRYRLPGFFALLNAIMGLLVILFPKVYLQNVLDMYGIANMQQLNTVLGIFDYFFSFLMPISLIILALYLKNKSFGRN